MQKIKIKIGKKYWFFLILLASALGFFLWPNASRPLAEAKNSPKNNYIESEVVAKIAPDADVSKIAIKYNLEITLLKTSPDGSLYILKSASGLSTTKLIGALQKDAQIISVQPNFKYKPLARIPNDALFSREWPLADTVTAAGGVSAPSAWDQESKKQTKIAIAMIDTGISYKLPEIQSSITGGRTKGLNISNAKKKPQDSDGHGTFIAGIIAAKTNNKKGLAGSSFFGNLKIMPLKFDFTTDQAISAINYAKAKHIPIINASWGAYGDDGLDLVLKDTIANFPGIFVTASGNGDPHTELGYNHDSGNPVQKMYPCDFDLANILCVGASDKNGNITTYSDFGATSVDVVAPGGTDDSPIVGLDLKKNRYASAEGSSLSTAYVSAEAGLILSKKPNLSAAQIIEIIKNSVDLEPSLTGKVSTGGKINFQKALQSANSY